jgi:hypothetical protein
VSGKDESWRELRLRAPEVHVECLHFRMIDRYHRHVYWDSMLLLPERRWQLESVGRPVVVRQFRPRIRVNHFGVSLLELAQLGISKTRSTLVLVVLERHPMPSLAVLLVLVLRDDVLHLCEHFKVGRSQDECVAGLVIDELRMVVLSHFKRRVRQRIGEVSVLVLVVYGKLLLALIVTQTVSSLA